MADPNLTGALRASLESFTENSPLAEGNDENSIDEYLDRINEDLVAGAVEKITDDRLHKLVDLYRAQALRWTQEEQTKAPRQRKSGGNAISIDL